MRFLRRASAVILASGLLVLGLASPAGATPKLTCGQGISHDVVLHQNLTCPGVDALTVGNVTVNLNGFTITGNIDTNPNGGNAPTLVGGTLKDSQVNEITLNFMHLVNVGVGGFVTSATITNSLIDSSSIGIDRGFVTLKSSRLNNSSVNFEIAGRALIDGNTFTGTVPQSPPCDIKVAPCGPSVVGFINVSQQGSAVITNNYFYRGPAGVVVNDAGFATVKDNTFEANGYGFYAPMGTHGDITDNVFSDDTLNGVLIGNLGNNSVSTISGNLFSQSGLDGLLISHRGPGTGDSASVVVKNNIALRNLGLGIDLERAPFPDQQPGGTDGGGNVASYNADRFQPPFQNADQCFGVVCAPFTQGHGWTGQAAFNPTNGYPIRGAGLTGVSCPSATFCMGVGFVHAIDGTIQVFAESWDGHSWQNSPITAPGSDDATLTGVSCVSTTACTAVGFQDAAFAVRGVEPAQPLIESWNGRTWTAQPTPPPPSIPGFVDLAELNAVSCTSARFCVAVGSNSPNYDLGIGQSFPLVEVWNGRQWSIPTVPGTGGSAALTGVSCIDGTCMAVGRNHPVRNPPATPAAVFATPGQPFAERWDGRSWTLESISANPTTAINLNAVSCASAMACTAVGDAAPNNITPSPLVEVFTGGGWNSVTSPNLPNSTLRAVSCTAPQSCTAVGSTTAIPGISGSNVRVAEMSMGRTWSVEPTPGGGDLRGVSCTSVLVCTAVGFSVATFEVPLALRHT